MKVLIACDGMDYSRFALDEAAKIVHEEASDVTVLSVVPSLARGSKSGGHMDLAPHAEEDVEVAAAYLRERGIEPETRIAHGVPAQEILAEVKAGDYDVIVLGARGLDPIGRLLFGSVSSKVAAGAPCVVVVAGETGSERFEPLAAAR